MEAPKRRGPNRRGGRGGGGGGGDGGRGGRRDNHRRGHRHRGNDASTNADSGNQPGAHQTQEDVPMISEAYRPPLTEAAPTDTPRFADLAGQGLLHSTLIETITHDLKFDHMMPVQASTLHELLPPNRGDCLVQAKTGTGKTIAFLLPAVQTMITKNRGPASGASLLVISPTRELAMQIANEASSLLKRFPNYKVRIAMGGTNKDREERQILQGCDILIATPGRLLDHFNNEDIRDTFSHLDTLVLDEADRLLDMGFLPDLKKIFACLPDKQATNRQGLLFSATIAPHVEKVAGLVCSPQYKFISTIPKGEVNTHERVPQLLVTVPDFSSVAPAMVGSIRQEVSNTPGFKAIVFAPTAALAGFYGHLLSKIQGLPSVWVLHSRISQSKRTSVTNEYRNAKSGILAATDVVARGMDFPGVTTVFQVGVPADKESYIHRLGRTARASAEGRGIFIVAEAESWFPRWSLKDIDFVPHEADTTSAGEVDTIATQMEEEEKAKIYQAWLGYYKNHLKPLKWSTEELVAQGNRYARNGLGSPDTPPLRKSTASKMGLRGVKGLYIVPDPQKGPGRGGNAGRGRGQK